MVVPTAAVLAKLKGVLFFDKRSSGSRGKSLAIDMPELALEKGDRLEVHARMCDVGMLDSMVAPCTLLFWRVKADTLTHRRVPLFDESIGITPSSTFALDSLHSMSLGVFQFLICRVMHVLVATNCWRVNETTQTAIAAMSMQLLTSELTAWCRSPSGAHATKIDTLKVSMFGGPPTFDCGLRGSETNGFLEFLVSVLLVRFTHIEHHADLRRAGLALVH